MKLNNLFIIDAKSTYQFEIDGTTFLSLGYKETVKLYHSDKTNGNLIYIGKFNAEDGFVKVNRETLVEKINNVNTPKKKNPIHVVRYIRPQDEYCISSNLYGVTLIFTLDYEKRLIDVGISVCNGDNFDRKVGVKLASGGEIGVKNALMPSDIYTGESKDGLVDWFIQRFPEEYISYRNDKNINTKININTKTINLINTIYSMSKYPDGE